MSARPEDIARLEALEQRKSHTRFGRPPTQDMHREKMLCDDCTLTPAVDLLTEAEIRETLKPLTDPEVRLSIVFEDPGPAADKHTSTPDAAAAYDRQRSAREGDSA